jgi:hypothetical protein
MMPEEVVATGTGHGCDGHPVDDTPMPCFRCGICCTCYQAPLDARDIESIASTLGISDAEFISRYALKVPTREGYLLRKHDDGCVFLAWEGERARCVIHRSRPQACRVWQPGLSQPACLEGLARLKTKGQLTQLDELLGSDEERREFYLSLEKALATNGKT